MLVRSPDRPQRRFPRAKRNHQDAIMSRQDANAAFALSSFLQGTNAAYIDDL
jgi:2-oxoglutarate dehydrogenase E1 component